VRARKAVRYGERVAAPMAKSKGLERSSVVDRRGFF
jgi:hypothetical protein